MNRKSSRRSKAKTGSNRPFCPPQAELIIKPHQVTQQPSLIKDLQDGITRLFKSS